MSWVVPSKFIQTLYRSKRWRVSSLKKEIFLTFDDGPEPAVTPWVLDMLKQHGAKATFFCVGENVKKYPELFQRIQDEGHAVGNHTMRHVNGWKTSKQNYLAEVQEAQHYIPSKLFRPPYGKLKLAQTNALLADYAIIMWTFLTYDFDSKVDMSVIYRKWQNIQHPGAIVVFHDSLKAEQNLQEILPKILTWTQEQQYSCKALQA